MASTVRNLDSSNQYRKPIKRYPKSFIIWLLNQDISMKSDTMSDNPNYLVANISWHRLTIEELYEKYKKRKK